MHRIQTGVSCQRLLIELVVLECCEPIVARGALTFENLRLLDLAYGHPEGTVMIGPRVFYISIGRGVLHLSLILLLKQLSEVVRDLFNRHNFDDLGEALLVRLSHFYWILFKQLLRLRPS